jgi:arginine-tRNA-protein transferase
MREIAFCLENDYRYYYMGRSQSCNHSLLVGYVSNYADIGYYIHSCQKMRYKANFRPQYILGMFHPVCRY